MMTNEIYISYKVKRQIEKDPTLFHFICNTHHTENKGQFVREGLSTILK